MNPNLNNYFSAVFKDFTTQLQNNGTRIEISVEDLYKAVEEANNSSEKFYEYIRNKQLSNDVLTANMVDGDCLHNMTETMLNIAVTNNKSFSEKSWNQRKYYDSSNQVIDDTADSFNKVNAKKFIERIDKVNSNIANLSKFLSSYPEYSFSDYSYDNKKEYYQYALTNEKTSSSGLYPVIKKEVDRISSNSGKYFYRIQINSELTTLYREGTCDFTKLPFLTVDNSKIKVIKRFYGASADVPLYAIATFVKDITVNVPKNKVVISQNGSLTEADKRAIRDLYKEPFVNAMKDAGDNSVDEATIRAAVDNAKVKLESGKLFISVPGMKTQVVNLSSITQTFDAAKQEATNTIKALTNLDENAKKPFLDQVTNAQKPEDVTKAVAAAQLA
ncbi:hypothetical protein HMPREF9248_0198, partial [Fannyhessea vaginae PB189-T1-4]